MKHLLPISLLLLCIGTQAETTDTLTADFARTRYHYGHLTQYLEQHNDYTIYQGVYQGQWADGDPLIFSVAGNSWRWNKYYIDGMRVDDRFHPGSSLYRPNLEHNNLQLDYRTSRLRFETDATEPDYVQLTGNVGNLGGINPTTEGIIHTFHGTGTEGADDPDKVQHRQYTRGAGTLESQYTFLSRQGQPLRQHLYATFGNRRLPNYNQDGLLPDHPLTGANYYTVQFDGQLPSLGRLLPTTGYRLNYSMHGSSGSEHYQNPAEQSTLSTFSATVFGKRSGLTSGLTWSTNSLRHNNFSFTRNIIDQDGESLSPWSPDGKTNELTWYADYRRPLLPWLQLHAEAYNSLIHHAPKEAKWWNPVYEQQSQQQAPRPLYLYEWQSRAFAGGLLENSVGLEARHDLGSKASLTATADLTLDGIVLKDKTHIMPNGQASLSLDVHPYRWFRMGLNLGYDRVNYSIEHLRYFSNDYLNGRILFYNSRQPFSTTGGSHHQYSSRSLMQPSYLTVDIPIRLTFGRHEIALLQTYRKHCNTWMTSFADGPEANGYYEDGIFFLRPGQHNYVVGSQPHSLMGGGFLTNTPYHMSQLTRYTYRGRKVMFSLSWQSLMTVGPSALGVGPAANDIGVLCESTANPNTHCVMNGANSQYPAVGRLDQDKAYVCRIYLGYNVCRHLQFGITGKWTDGQPFSVLNTYTSSQDGQLAIVPVTSRGINPTDGNFGCRESAIFNIDLHARASWAVRGHEMQFNLLCYNLYDFGNVLNEYMFPQGLRGLSQRGPNMCLTIPRGLICSLKVEL